MEDLFLRAGTLDDASLSIEPDDGASWTAFDGDFGSQGVLRVIDHRELVVEANQSLGGIHHTATTSGASDLAKGLRLIGCGEVLACYPKLVADGLHGKELFGADFDAIPASRT